MLGKVFSLLIVSSFVFSLINGNAEEVSRCITASAADAVTLSLSLAGIVALWSGVVHVLDKAGGTKLLARICRPILRRIYPAAFRKHIGENEIAANFAANLLGLGNAALPLGLSVMKALSVEKDDIDLQIDRKTFAVMNTVPPQLFPTTLFALRAAADSAAPFEVLLPIWLCSAATFCFAGVLCRIVGKLSRANAARKRRSRER